MKKYVVLLLLLAVLLIPVSAHASGYLYFTGWFDAEAKRSGVPEQVNVWDLSEDTYHSLEIEGYLIGKSSEERGCYVALDVPGSLKSQIEVAYCAGGSVQETRNVSVPGNVLRIYAIMDDWIYYGYQNSAEDYGICRADADGNVEYYDVRGCFASASGLEELTCAVSDGGCIAFNANVYTEGMDAMFSPLKLSVAWPNGRTYSIWQSDAHLACAWLAGEKLVFTDKEARVYVYDAQEESAAPLLLEDGNLLVLDSIPQTNICASSEDMLLAYQVYNPERLFGLLPAVDDGWNPLTVVSLTDGTQRSSERVCINPFGWSSHSTQMQFGG